MAQARKLTETAVRRALVPPGKAQAFLWDGQVTGFGVRLLAAGSKTFWFQYRPPGGRSVSARMVRIGAWPAVSLNDARKAARDLAGQVARGIDPAAKRQAERAKSESTLRTLLAEGGPYERELARRQIVNAKAALSALRRGLVRSMGKEVTALTRADFVAAITAVEDQGKPGAAADLRRHCRTFLEWCVSAGRASHNVLAGLRRPQRSRAERLKAASNGGRALTDDQIRQLWQTAGGFGSFGCLVRLALLTGARRGELAGLERNHLLADRLVVVAEHAKTGAQHEIPLTDLMRQVIASASVTASPLLFPSPVTGGKLKGWTKLVARLQQTSGVDFRLHDLRRTTRTLMSRLGVLEDIAELAIGHVRDDLVRRYNRDEAWGSRVDAFARVSAHIVTLVGQPTSKVVPLGAESRGRRQ
jgi:integrase